MNIRAIRPEDSRLAVSRIYEESWRWAYRGIVPRQYLDAIPAGHWAAFLDSPGIFTLVAEDGGELVGTTSFCASRFADYPGMGELVSLYLLPRCAGKGIGKVLMDAAVSALESMGFSRIFLWVLEDNRRARRFYEKAGFRLGPGILNDEICGKALRELQYVKELA